ncbi:MAG TPA: sigma-54 dependent transcriptional regulator [Candidatus Methylacidiphilales bacterium]|nr:sigma-54 dependent transcriptional regulator [Candidatus Methylacidiphilales bacterium]
MVVEDDASLRRTLVATLQKIDIPVLAVGTCAQAREEQQKEPADLVISDLQLPDGSGMDLLEEFKEVNTAVEVVIMTGFGTIESAVEAMKRGASNYLLKPFTNSQLQLALAQITERRSLRVHNNYLRDQLAEESGFSSLLGVSPEMKQVQKWILQVAPTDATVLIEGESGTGKEVIARALHEKSLRRDKPYIKVNCAAVPGNLLESEFFGHEKGAFTGASAKREGRFELADGGTLLLDEITEISLPLQAKLLRVLQEHEFERVGGSRTLRADARILATTNRDLAHAVASGQFRQDLYYRLNVVPLAVPRLAERQGEVEFLLGKFLERFARQHNKPVLRVGPIALDQLARYPWPGNVRELRNYAERAVILSTGDRELTYTDLIPAAPAHPDDPIFGNGAQFPTLADIEKRLIFLALKKTNGNRNEAAGLVGINPRTLRNKLKEYAQSST